MKYIGLDYVIRLSKTKDELLDSSGGKVIKEDSFLLEKQKKTKCSALLVYRCSDCDTVIATTTASGVFDATASQVAAETRQLRCSKCEENY